MESLKRAQIKYTQKLKRLSLRFRYKEHYLYDYLKTKKSMNNHIINLIKEDYEKNK